MYGPTRTRQTRTVARSSAAHSCMSASTFAPSAAANASGSARASFATTRSYGPDAMTSSRHRSLAGRLELHGLVAPEREPGDARRGLRQGGSVIRNLDVPRDALGRGTVADRRHVAVSPQHLDLAQHARVGVDRGERHAEDPGSHGGRVYDDGRRPTVSAPRIARCRADRLTRMSVSLVAYGLGNLGLGRQHAQAGRRRVAAGVHARGDPRERAACCCPASGRSTPGMPGCSTRGWAHRAIKEFAASGKPLFGICLGMQLLLDGSEEGERARPRPHPRHAATRFAESPRPAGPAHGLEHRRPRRATTRSSTGSSRTAGSTSCTATGWCPQRDADVLGTTDLRRRRSPP